MNSIFSGPITSVLSAMRFDGHSFTCQCEEEEEDKKADGFQISQFYWLLFQVSDIMAVKGLMGAY